MEPQPAKTMETIAITDSELIANKVIAFFPKWIRKSQITFVKGRSIFDNILMAWKSIEWAIHSNKNLILLLLDLEKAYDRVTWTFMQQTMKQMGFLETFIGWVMALYVKHLQPSQSTGWTTLHSKWKGRCDRDAH